MKFRKKPVVIEAVQIRGGQLRGIAPQWFAEAADRGEVAWRDGGLFVKTLEGEMRANESDWIIRGVKGEIYPCKPDIFEATYEPAE